MFKQYLQIKSKYPDCILFFRLGDFYEMFFEDAETVSKLLGLVLTKREAGKDFYAPMCGIPVEKSDFYIQRLLELGFKVAICEQVEDPALAKGLVRREVVRTYTPGLNTDISYLPGKDKVYLASFLPGSKVELAFLELSCGEFIYTELPFDKALAEILKKEPREIILPENLKDEGETTHGSVLQEKLQDKLKALLPNTHLTFLPKKVFQDALSAIRYYVETYQPELKDRLTSPLWYYPEDYLFLDENAKRHLELTRNLWDGSTKYSLYWVLDETITPMGGRLLKEWILYPLRDAKEIIKRQSAVEFFYERKSLRNELRSLLQKISDLERIAQRCKLRLATPKELALLRDSLSFIPSLKALFEEEKSLLPELLSEILEKISEFRDLYELLKNTLVEDPAPLGKGAPIIKPGISEELDTLRSLKENSIEYLANLERELRIKTGLPNLKLGYNKVFGYFIELPKAQARLAPPYFERKQTLVNAERFTTPELKDLEAKIVTAEEKIKALEAQLFYELRDKVSTRASALLETARAIAVLDILQALALVAERENYVKPEITEERELIIEEGRHPVLEKVLGPHNFIPNSLHMNEASRLHIITGPNMGGKSTFLRQNALIIILAQMGSFVPATYAKIPVFDRVFTRIGAADELIRGRSTFMVEMSECANILKNSTSQSFVILDEVGRGTSTFDGLALAWAIAEKLYQKGVFTLLATHYFELTDLAKTYEGIKNYHVEVKEWGNEVVFLYRIKEGRASQSYGIEVAKLAGLDEDVIKRAQEILSKLEEKNLKSTTESKRAKQLSIFVSPAYEGIIEKLRKINIETLTPLQALQILAELKGELKS
ncbi:MAG: DNA mismatch repair protein MutS [Thermodesulfobacteriaceae bacterium]|jgi:DNA mismatch repair protein MutS